MIDSVGNSGLSNVQRAGSAWVREVASSGGSCAEVAVRGKASGGSILTDLAAAPPPVQGERVATLRAAIAEGRYVVSAERIAQAMMGTD